MVVKANCNLSSQVQYNFMMMLLRRALFNDLCLIKPDPIINRVILIDNTPNSRKCCWAFLILKTERAVKLSCCSWLLICSRIVHCLMQELYKLYCFITTIVWIALTKQSLHSWGQSGPGQRSPVTLSFSSANSRKCSITFVTVGTINHFESNKSGLVLSQYTQDDSLMCGLWYSHRKSR